MTNLDYSLSVFFENYQDSHNFMSVIFSSFFFYHSYIFLKDPLLPPMNILRKIAKDTHQKIEQYQEILHGGSDVS